MVLSLSLHSVLIRVVNIEVSSIADTLSPIFFSISEGVAILLKKESVEELPILFWPKKIDTFYRYFFLFNIDFNGLPQFTAVKRLFILGGKIFSPFLTHLSKRHFEIIVLFMQLYGETSVKLEKWLRHVKRIQMFHFQ